jgi:DNA-directed RNA polymerase subunit RPC12/RpoP
LEIQKQSQFKMMLKRMIPMAVPGILLAAAGKNPITMIAGALLLALALVAGAVWAAKEMEKNPERLLNLEEQFKIDYACPACKKLFGAHNSWESLRRQGKCPYCGRKFNVKN